MKKTKWKFPVIICLSVTYVTNFLLMTIGYFTPSWAVNLLEAHTAPFYDYNGYYRVNISKIKCDTAGLVSGYCRYDFTNSAADTPYYMGLDLTEVWNFEKYMRKVFYIETAAIAGLYVNTILLMAGIVFRLLDDQIYRPFLSISFGVIYPVSGLLSLAGSIFAEANLRSNTGYSCILCTIAGALSVVLYVCLRIYDHKYILSRTGKVSSEDSKQVSSGTDFKHTGGMITKQNNKNKQRISV